MIYDRPTDSLFVEDKLTPLTEAEAAYHLREAYKELTGHYPKLESLAIVWAQSALEVYRWKSIHNNNWGNIKRLKDQPYTSYKCSEIINGKNTWFFPYHPQTFFASWDSATEGAKAYLNFLYSRPRYAEAWKEIEAGNPVKYSAALKRAGYYTADLVGYTKGVVSLTNEFKSKSEALLSYQPPKPQEEIIPPPLFPEVNFDKLEENNLPTDPIKESSFGFSYIIEIIKKLFNIG